MCKDESGIIHGFDRCHRLWCASGSALTGCREIKRLPFPPVNGAVKSQSRKEHEVNETAVGNERRKPRAKRREQAGGHENEQSVDMVTRVQLLQFVQLEHLPHSPRMHVEEREREIHGREAEAIDNEQRRGLLAVHGHSVRRMTEEQIGDAEIKQKLQRVDEEEDKEQHRAGEEARGPIFQPVAATEFVVAVPDDGQEEETKRES